VLEVDQRLGGRAQLDRDRLDVPAERVEEVVGVPELDLLVPAHALLARQPAALARPGQADPVAAEPHLAHAEAGRGPHGRAHVVRVLRIHQADRGRHPVAGPDRSRDDPHVSCLPVPAAT